MMGREFLLFFSITSKKFLIFPFWNPQSFLSFQKFFFNGETVANNGKNLLIWNFISKFQLMLCSMMFQLY